MAELGEGYIDPYTGEFIFEIEFLLAVDNWIWNAKSDGIELSTSGTWSSCWWRNPEDLTQVEMDIGSRKPSAGWQKVLTNEIMMVDVTNS